MSTITRRIMFEVNQAPGGKASASAAPAALVACSIGELFAEEPVNQVADISAVAPVRSRITGHRIDGSESSSQSTAVMTN